MNRIEKRSKFAELAKAYVLYQVADEDLEVVEASEHPETLVGHAEDTARESFEQAIELYLKLKMALFDELAVHARFCMFHENSHFQLTYWKQGESGMIDPKTRLRDPAPGQLRAWLKNDESPISVALPRDNDNDDPLMALFGTVESELTDIADRHDDYLGQALLEELRAEEDD